MAKQTKKPKRYALIGGIPYTGYTGTTTFTGLKVLARTDNKSEMKKLTEDHADDSAHLILWLDLQTGKPC